MYGIKKAVYMDRRRLCVWDKEGCVYGQKKAVCMDRRLCVWELVISV